jgi:DNA-binding XRE family transcriptional regulator
MLTIKLWTHMATSDDTHPDVASDGNCYRLGFFNREFTMDTMTRTNRIPNKLRQYREQAGLRQHDIAKALGMVSSDRISHWENGVAVPNIVNLFKLSVLYCVPPHELYGELFRTLENQLLKPGSSNNGTTAGSA